MADLKQIEGGIPAAVKRVEDMYKQLGETIAVGNVVEFVYYVKDTNGAYEINQSGGINRHKLAGVLLEMATMNFTV